MRDEVAKMIPTIKTINDLGEEEEKEVLLRDILFKNDKLKERIHIRLLKRVENGMIKEVEKLYENGLSWERMEELGLEYRYISRYLRNLITKEKMLKQLEMEIWHYAKRQMVWWKRNNKIAWREVK